MTFRRSKRAWPEKMPGSDIFRALCLSTRAKLVGLSIEARLSHVPSRTPGLSVLSDHRMKMSRLASTVPDCTSLRYASMPARSWSEPREYPCPRCQQGTDGEVWR